MSLSRSAKESPFPYTSPLVCYMALDQNGVLIQVDRGFSAVSEAYRRAMAREIRLYAVWPGNYRSDLFEIDDLNAFADAFGVMRPDGHIHDLDWKLSSIDDGKSRYTDVDIVFKCGCTLSFQNIKKIANDMQQQKGWHVATSKGISGNGFRYTISVERRSLGSPSP